MPPSDIPCDGVFTADIGGHAVVLDLKADRYALRPDPARLADWEMAQSAHTGQGVVPRVQSSLWPGRRVHLTAMPRAWAALRAVSTSLETEPFERLVELVAGAPVARRRAACGIAALVAAFEQIRPFFPRGRICRLDAPALCLLLRRYGYAAQLVFGARLEPFGAHCWVQLGDVAVDDADVKVRTYTPLLAV